MSSLGPFTLVPPSHFTASVGLFLDQLSFAAFPVAPYCGDHFTFSFFFPLPSFSSQSNAFLLHLDFSDEDLKVEMGRPRQSRPDLRYGKWE